MKDMHESIVNRHTYTHVATTTQMHLFATSPILHSTDTLAMYFVCRRRSYCVSASSLHTAIQRMTTGLHDHECMVPTAYTIAMVVITVGYAARTLSFNTMNG